MSSSDDDMPLVRNKSKANGNGTYTSPKTKTTISEKMDRPMKGADGSSKNGPKATGAIVNGDSNSKRKMRQSIEKPKSYKDASDEDSDDEPMLKRQRISIAKKPNRKSDVMDTDSDDGPLLSTKKPAKARNLTKPSPKASDKLANTLSDSDTPLGQKLANQKEIIHKRASNEAKTIRKGTKQASMAKKVANGTSSSNKATNGVKPEDSSDDSALISRTPMKKLVANAKSESSTPVKKGKAKAKKEESPEEDVEEEEEEYRWWEDPTKGDGTKKWATLEHCGVVFPPEYEPLPKSVKLLYDGSPVILQPAAEEVAGFFGAMLNSTVNMENPTFVKNFFEDFQEILKETGGAKDRDGNKIKIREMAKCDFKPIFNYYEAKRMEKKALSTAAKKELKTQKDEAEKPYMYCLWDGRKEKVGNFRVEPPGLFRGRGQHPKTGRVKKRVLPEQISINIGKEAQVPAPPEGHKWKEIKHDQEGTWLAMWQENINGAYKYVMLAANSSIKGQSDFKKFEKARELKKHILRIRKDYTRELKAELMADRQRATAVYLIDEFALRAGNEKGEDEADTVGCCSLKFEHVTLKPPNKVIFDFLGKDSIRFYDEVEVIPQVFKNLKIFKKAPKRDGDEIFDRLTTTKLNKHLANYMDGLTAKVFRTYNASFTMSNLLKDMKSHGTIPEKIKDYNDANRQVAILCNHKRTVGAGHAGQMEKLIDRVKGLQYQKWRLKQMMLDLEPKLKKKKGADYFEYEDDLDEAWIQDHQKYLVEEQRQKIEKKFQKENETLAAEGKKEMKAKELQDRLEIVSELEKKFKRENKTGKVEAEGRGPTIEKLEANITKLDQRIETMRIQAEDKESNKEVALGTSKINYIDPRLTVVFSKKFNVPIEKFFSKTLREKFDWAIKSVAEDWEF